MQHLIKALGITTVLLASSAYAETVSFPKNAALTYSGNGGVTATMAYGRSASNYNINTTFKIPLYSMQFRSSGSMSGNTMIPNSYSDTRRGKLYAQAKFNHGSKTITYGKAGENKTATMRGVPMDLFSLAWQLALNNGKVSGVSQFTNGKKVYNEATNIRAAGTQNVKFKGKPLSVNMYRATRGGDVMEYGLAPSLGNIPALIRYTDDGKTYQLNLTAATLDGKKY